MMHRTARILFALFLPACATGCEQIPDPLPLLAKSVTPSRPEIVRVSTVKPERMTLRRLTEAPGQIQALETTSVHARIGGYVKTVSVNIGDLVKTGQLLASLDVPEIEAEVEQKKAEVEQAEADLALFEAAVAVSKTSVSTAQAKAAEARATTRRTVAEVSRWEAESLRIEQLAREAAVTGSLRDETRSKLEAARAAGDEAKAQVVSAEAAVEESRSRLERAKAEVGSSRARIKVANADLRKANATLGFSRIIAPYDGVITRRRIDPGNLTVPGGSADPLFMIARMDVVTVVVAVPEAEAAQVESGVAAKVRIQSLRGRELAGKVSRTSWSLDQGTRSLRVEIDFPNPEGSLRPGLYAYATIVVAETRDALTLPSGAIVRENGKTFCVLVEEGKSKRVPVRLSLSDGTRVAVVEGLTGSEIVVVAGADGLMNGQSVEPIKTEKPAEPTRK